MVVTPEGSCSPAYRAAGARPGAADEVLPVQAARHYYAKHEWVFDFCLQSWKVPVRRNARDGDVLAVGRLLRR